MRLARIALSLLASLVATGCTKDISSPFLAVVVAWDPAKQVYELAQVKLSTLISLRDMQGTSGNVTAGGSARLVTSDTLRPTASISSLRQAAFLTAPGPVAVEFNTANGLVYPEDEAALELVSFYAALEKARAELSIWGFSNLVAAPIFSHTDLRNEDFLSPLAEGELFYEPLNAFFLPVLNPKQQIPPQLNLGVVAHAVAIQAWQQVVWAGAPVDPAALLEATDPAALTSVHVAQSLRIGIGDFLGTLITVDPRWFDHSLPQTASARALDQLRCGSTAMLDALDVPDKDVPYDPYPLGTVLAYSLWDTALNSDPTAVVTGVVAALPGIAAAQNQNGGKLALAAALDAIVAATQGSAQGYLCGELLNGFHALSVTDLPACDTIGVHAPPASCR